MALGLKEDKLMVIFEVLLNGKPIYKVGASDLTHSVVSVHAKGKLGPTSESAIEPRAFIEALAKTGTANDDGEARKWASSYLHLGDVIEIRLIEGESADAPVDTQKMRQT